MATRDRSQGFGFVYTDLAQLLANKGAWNEDSPTPATAKAKSVNFNKDTLFPASAPSDSTPLPQAAPLSTAEQIQKNLDRLQTLHQRIHSMLEELNQLGPKKKKP